MLELSGLRIALYLTQSCPFGLYPDRTYNYADADAIVKRPARLLSNSDSIPRHFFKAVLLGNRRSSIMSKISGRAHDYRLDSAAIEPNRDASW
jgi:hypothetical protein